MEHERRVAVAVKKETTYRNLEVKATEHGHGLEQVCRDLRIREGGG